MATPTDVSARLNAVPTFAGTAWRAEPLPGGLTNRNYRVTTADGVYVARLSEPSGALLAIDRAAEYRCAVAAAQTGIAPRVVDHSAGSGVLVIEWLPGRTLGPQDLRDPGTLVRVAESLRRLHSGARFGVDFDMFAVQRRYLDVVRERGFRLPPRYLEFAAQVERIRSVLQERPVRTVPCHNDLLAANLIDDGRQIWVIDYEYAGDNDPAFELGNLWSESTLEPDLLEVLVAAYHGLPSGTAPSGELLRREVARARLFALMSKYGWMLWASIQDGVATLDFDFWSWGMEKYDRAVAEFDGPELPRWLEQAGSAGDRAQAHAGPSGT